MIFIEIPMMAFVVALAIVVITAAVQVSRALSRWIQGKFGLDPIDF